MKTPASAPRRAALAARWLGSFLLAAALPLAAATTLRVTGLEADGAVDPLGVDAPRPALAWRVASEERGQRQTAWQVRVATSVAKLAAGQADVWDSGRMDGDLTTVAYGGPALASSQQVFWQVRAWDARGEATAWSEPAAWTTGLLTAADWRAKWITSPERVENLLLRREFTVRPGLRRALAHVSGLGQYELFLNGTKAGADVLSPGWTNYRKTVLYDTRDVTALLREGPNAVGLSLGNGMLHVVRPPGRFAKFLGSFGPQRAILHLRLEYADGTVETVATDETWQTRSGPITFSSIYGGEDYDARLEPAGWKLPGFKAADLAPAVPFTGEMGALRGHSAAAEPVGPIETRGVTAVRELAPGVVLYDFGQNASFMPRLRISGPAGSVVKLTAGEIVNADGTINRGTMGGAHRGSAWWQYTKATDGEETWFPQFYYLGSRYLYTELLPAAEGGVRPKVESVEMVIVHSTARPAGHFATSDPMLNRIRDLVRWAQRSNMVSILTDCPHREKLGWLEQNHLAGPALRYEWDADRLFAKNIRDMTEAQQPDGLVPNIAPEYTVFKGTFRTAAEWGASFIVVPWQQYLFTGDATLLRTQYEPMQRYFAHLETRAAGGVLADGLGDWYDVILEKTSRAYLTPPPLTATAHYYLNAVTLEKIARVLGRVEDAQAYAAKAAAIRDAFNREFVKPGAPELVGSGSQTSLLLPLALGLAEPAQRGAYLAAALQDMDKRGHATTGAVGTRYLFRVLTDEGLSDRLYRLITNPDMPGYAYQLKLGNTALAESWPAYLGASQNHFFLGQVTEWFYHDLAGLAPDEAAPGFKHTIIRPHPVKDLAWVEAAHDSPHGRVAVRWEQKDGFFRLEATVPANTTATVYLPAREGAAVKIDDAAGVTAAGRDGDRAVYRIASGRYVFEVAR